MESYLRLTRSKRKNSGQAKWIAFTDCFHKVIDKNPTNLRLHERYTDRYRGQLEKRYFIVKTMTY